MLTPDRRPHSLPTSGFVWLLAGLGAATVGLPLVGLAVRVPWSTAAQDLTTPAALQALRLSLVSATSAAAVATAFGVPLGWIFARHSRWWMRPVRAVVLLPLVLPPVVTGVALLASFGRRGVFGGLLADIGIVLPFSTLGVVVAQTVVALPFVVITVEAGVRGLGSGHEEAAAVCGASPLFGFWRISIPMLRPTIVAAAVLAWARSLGEFGATVTFAGSLAGRTRTLPLAVVNELQVDIDGAITLSMALVVVSSFVLIGLRDRWLGAR